MYSELEFWLFASLGARYSEWPLPSKKHAFGGGGGSDCHRGDPVALYSYLVAVT